MSAPQTASSSGSVNGINGHSNGINSHHSDHDIQSVDGGAGSSQSSDYAPNGNSQPFYAHHNEEVVNNLYVSGFQQGNYADTILHVNQNVYRLHAIILSRSPFFVHLMSTSPQTGGQRVIYVDLEQEPELTHDGFAVALGYLYSSAALSMLRPDNARAVLAAACLLGGMEDLSQYAYQLCRQSISVETVGSWIELVDSLAPSGDGMTTPDVPKPSIFGFYAQRLKEDLYHFLVDTLPEILGARQPPAEGNPTDSNGREVLLEIYSRLPFDLFKTAVESPGFRIDALGTDQARFKFAKDVIELRKKGISRGTGAEETVVLAFGGGGMNGSSVHITRKTRKRPLWKVNA